MQFSAQTHGPVTDQYDTDRDAWIDQRARIHRAAGFDYHAAADMAIEDWYAEHYGD